MKSLPLPAKLKPLFPIALLLTALSPLQAEIKPDALALAKELAAKLQSAQTIKVSAKHKLDQVLGVGSKLDAGPVEVTFKRPNLFYAVQDAKDATREIAYDGRTLCVMHPGMKHHALESIKAGTIEQFSDLVDTRFGFRPPLAELLANDLAAHLMLNVRMASVIGKENVGWSRCERLRLVQEGMTADLWIGVKDKLPRRMLFTFTDHASRPTWDIRLSKWDLNPAVDSALFSKRPAGNSTKVKMIKSR
jgi:hypothetical protein